MSKATDPVPLTLIARIAETFEALGIPYLIGGSVASMVHGIPRLTRDVDFVVELGAEQIAPLVRALEHEFYVEEAAAREAYDLGTSFNVIHLETIDKAALFISPRDGWGRSQMARRRALAPDPARPEARVFFATPEDNALSKLRWYRLGGEVSTQQWNDVLGILKIQAGRLELEYLRHWAPELGVTDLLERALDEAGLPPEPSSERKGATDAAGPGDPHPSPQNHS
jgi:hypothetical protein